MLHVYVCDLLGIITLKRVHATCKLAVLLEIFIPLMSVGDRHEDFSYVYGSQVKMWPIQVTAMGLRCSPCEQEYFLL